MKDFLIQHFDKLLLTGLLIFMVWVVLHMARIGDAQDINWAREQSNLIVGALLGLITGAVLRNGTKTEPPEEKKP